MNVKGFTLIEMMVVITIIGCLATIITPSLLKHLDNAEIAATEMSLDGLITAIGLYRYHCQEYPDDHDDLDDLIKEPHGPGSPTGWNGPYLTKPVTPLDAWGNEFQYKEPGTHNTTTYDLWSMGPDGSSGGGASDDDIINWMP